MRSYRPSSKRGKGSTRSSPHGFETVTYMLEGQFEHKDSRGNAGKIGPGDVQWMTAGAGVVHSEMPEKNFAQKGGRLHGFQLWVNLPRKDKMISPRYQDIQSSKIPVSKTPDSLVTTKVIAGKPLNEPIARYGPFVMNKREEIMRL
jgi:quercetin 2,3-dioxygenase